MKGFARLAIETRAGLEDKAHLGYVCCVDETGRTVLSAGDEEEVIFLRSAAKPIQALPVIRRRLDEKYGLTEEESAIFAGSHLGQACHTQALTSMLDKTGLREEDMCMLPCRPECKKTDDGRIARGLPLRRLYHNCSGKHVALMLLQRELGGPVEDYWKRGSACQKEVLSTIARFMEMPEERIPIGVDGCGVPVFAAPMRNIALSFLNLMRPARLGDEALRETVERYVPRLHKYPYMMKGYGDLCTLLCGHENILAKGGANGLFCVGLHREGIGIAFRTIDGDIGSRPLILAAILEKLGLPPVKALDELGAGLIHNDTGEVVGEARAEIEWNRK